MTTLRYGTGLSVELKFDRCTLVAECGNPPTGTVADVAELVEQVLTEPTGIPPLSRCVTPSDQIVIALDEGVPEGGKIGAAVVRHLAACGVDPDVITVLRSAADAAVRNSNPLPHLREELRRRVRLVDHSPGDRAALAFLATGRAGNPIWLNRALTDADVVIPIG